MGFQHPPRFHPRDGLKNVYCKKYHDHSTGTAVAAPANRYIRVLETIEAFCFIRWIDCRAVDWQMHMTFKTTFDRSCTVAQKCRRRKMGDEDCQVEKHNLKLWERLALHQLRDLPVEIGACVRQHRIRAHLGSLGFQKSMTERVESRLGMALTPDWRSLFSLLPALSLSLCPSRPLARPPCLFFCSEKQRGDGKAREQREQLARKPFMGCSTKQTMILLSSLAL